MQVPENIRGDDRVVGIDFGELPASRPNFVRGPSMPIAIDFTGKAALVTGASQGIGAEIVRTLHRSGARVILNHPDLGDGRTRADAEAIAAELNRDRGDSAHVVAADVADSEAVRRMMAEARDRCGGLDFLVNNAGILRDRSIANMTLEEWR